MASPHHNKNQRTRAGFTLLELMVALVAGIIAITAIYAVSAGSTRHFHEQQRIAQTQMALRMATQQLRDDLEKAGVFGTPNSRRETRCATPATEVQAVTFLDDEDSLALPEAALNQVTADRLVLTGAYASPAAYMITGLDAGGGTVFLQREWQGFRRDFGPWGAGFDPVAFNEVFAAGRMLHIVTLRGQHFFSRITGTNPGSASININNIPVGGHCVGGLADGATVSVLSQIQYRVVNPTSEPSLSDLLSANADVRGLTPSVLLRRELEFGTDAPIPSTERVVLEYVANFDVSFVQDRAANPGDPPDIQLVAGPAAEALIAMTPERLRAVRVSLSARTAGQEDHFPWVPRAAGAPLTRYRVNTTSPGAARVRTINFETVLPNLASRVLR